MLPSYPIQYSCYSGAHVHTLQDNLTDVSDFYPDIAVIIIGTNDLYSVDTDLISVTMNIVDLVDRLLFMENVQIEQAFVIAIFFFSTGQGLDVQF
jgi:hypothetical protein